MELIYQEDYERNSVRMYLRIKTEGRSIIIGQKDGELIEQVFDPINPSKEPPAPLLEMNRYFAEEFLKAVGNYNSKVGIRNENENLLKGKLEATEKHLEDLRVSFAKTLDKVLAS